MRRTRHPAATFHMTTATAPDRWSLTSWFTAFGAPDYLEFKTALAADAGTMQQRAADGPDLAALMVEYEALTVRLGHLSAYLGALSADDSGNEAVKCDEAWLSALDAGMEKARALLQGRLAALTDAAFASLLQSPALAGAEHTLGRMREAGRRQMPADREALAADLNVDGLHAWGRLYETLTGKLTFPMTFPDGHVETVPMARRRALMSEPVRALRMAAFRDGQQPWHDHADTLAAALNGIAGTRLTLYKERGLSHFLETPLHDAAMSRASLEAMHHAIRTHIEIPRRAVRRAAQLQGTEALHFCDLEAPQVPCPDDKPLTWDEACSIVDRSFSAAYPALGSYFRGMLEKQWIEAQPRAGKRPGAFCTGSELRHEERCYMTFHNTVHDMVTLAHEVGHAWHSAVLRPARAFASSYPMTLAETASNFGEMILLDGLLSDPAITPATRHWLLDQEVLRAHAYLLNIPMRFEFEHAFYTERAAGEVTVSRLRTLMAEAQRSLYGDTLLPGGCDDMFWASKMHFFISGLSFYNFPYTTGYLLSQALYAQFRAEGAAFLPRYESFLAATGSATCEEVARQSLGADLTSPDFWAAGITVLEDKVREYEQAGSAAAV
jgi:oligoendopeptidase F